MANKRISELTLRTPQTTDLMLIGDPTTGYSFKTTLSAILSNTVTSVALTMPSAFAVAGSPITSSGTFAVTAVGNSSQYIAGDGTLVTFPIAGQAGTLVREVRNETGATLTKGTVVYINGASGNKPTVAKAIATADATSAQTFGVVQNDISNNNNGYVVAYGDLIDLDTSAFTAGAQLYLSSTVAGGFTTTKQYAPAHLVYVGVVTRSHATQGRIEVRIQNGYEMDELHDVSAQSPNNNDILQFKSSTGLWTKTAGTTTNIAEGTNLYYTDARARAALSFAAGSGAYNSTTGVITIPTNNNQITNGAGYITSAALSGYVQGSGTINQLAYFSGTSTIASLSTATYPSLTELSYVKGVTSAIQTQLNAKVNSGASATFSDLTVTSIPTGIVYSSGGSFGSLSFANTRIAVWNGSTLTGSNSFRFVEDSNARLLIGATDDLSTALQVNGGGKFSGTIQSNDQNAFWLYQSGNPSDTKYWAIQNLVSSGTFRIRALNDALSNGINAIEIARSGISSVTTSFMGGNVGIGTISPNRKLVVQGNYTSNEQLLYLKQGDDNGFSFNIDAAVTGNLMIKGVNAGTETSSLLTIRRDNGNIGIGTVSPGEKLTINGGLGFQYSGTQNWHIATNSSNNITFSRSGIADRMTITSDGNIGIGVTPSAWGGNTNKVIEFSNGVSLLGNLAVPAAYLVTNTYSANGGSTWLYKNTDKATQYIQYDGQHIWYTAPSGTAGNAISFTQAMTLDASGRLGIGTTSPDARLRVSGSYNGTQAIFGVVDGRGLEIATALTTGTNDAGSILNARGAGSGTLIFQTEGSERMRITSGGNVGIGISPSFKFQVAMPSSGAGVVFRTTGNTNNPGIFFTTDEATSKGTILVSGSTGALDLSLGAGGGEIMYLKGSGRVLIGTTTDNTTDLLQVAGTIYSKVGSSGAALASNRIAVFEHNVNGVVQINVPDANSGGLFFGRSGSAYYSGIERAGTNLNIRNNDINALVISSTGAATFSSTIQTAAPSGRTAQPWKLGNAGISIGGSNGSAVAVEINGTVYYLMTAYLP